MRLTKIKDAQVDIYEMSELYGGSIDMVIMKHLNDDFVGQCHDSCLYLKINKVIRSGDVIVTYAAGTTKSYVNVQFEAEVMQYAPREGLVCKVLHIDSASNYMQAEKTDQIAVNMHRAKKMKTIQNGQLVPIRVIKSGYQIAKRAISISGTLYLIPQSETYIFHIGALTEDDIADLQPYLDEISALEKDIKKLDKKMVKYFNDLVYPFTKTKIVEGNQVSMLKLKASGYIVRHERTDKLTPFIHVLKKKPKNGVVQIQPAKLVYQAFLNDYKLHILFIIDMVNSFEDPSVRKSHKNLWEIYKSYKKP